MLQQGCAATAAVFRCSEGGVMVTAVFFFFFSFFIYTEQKLP